MILTFGKSDKNGNSLVRVSTDNMSESFTIQTNNDGLQFCHSIRNCRAYHLTDEQKSRAENELRNYVRKVGTARQKRIVDYI